VETGGFKVTWEGVVATFVCLMVGTLVVMVYLGDVVAILISAVLFTVVCIVIGVVIALASQSVRAKQDQQAFIANAKENLGIILTTQRMTNLQTQDMLRRLPSGVAGQGLTFSDGVFNSLEESYEEDNK